MGFAKKETCSILAANTHTLSSVTVQIHSSPLHRYMICVIPSFFLKKIKSLRVYVLSGCLPLLLLDHSRAKTRDSKGNENDGNTMMITIPSKAGSRTRFLLWCAIYSNNFCRCVQCLISYVKYAIYFHTFLYSFFTFLFSFFCIFVFILFLEENSIGIK